MSEDNAISQRAEQIYALCYKDFARERVSFLTAYAVNFLKTYAGMLTAIDPSDQYNFEISKERIIALVDSYFLEVSRYKDYHTSCETHEPFTQAAAMHVHKNNFLKRSKVAAFTVKWILKTAPLAIYPNSIYTPTPEKKKIIVEVNAHYAFQVAMRLLEIDMKNITGSETRELIYHFMYRDYDDRSFFMIFENLRAKYSSVKSSDSTRSQEVSAQDKSTNNSEAKNKSKPKNNICVLIAHTIECQDYAEMAYDFFKNKNDPKLKRGGVDNFNVAMWPQLGSAGVTNDMQGDLFSNFEVAWGKTEPDILVILVRNYLGKGTKEEFDKYLPAFLSDKNNKLVIFHQIFDDKSSNSLSDVETQMASARLREWIEKDVYKDGITYKIDPISVDRNRIITKEQFLQRLGVEIDKYWEK
jgi:hypothetical protein